MDEEEVVNVKVEDEMGIFVKEEETFIEGTNYNEEYDEYDENAPNFEELLVEPYPELNGKELLVYTRKVDDIWTRNFKINKIRTVLNRLERKSKPLFTGRFKKRKKRKYMVKFRRFVQNLQDYNDTVARYNEINQFYTCTQDKAGNEEQRMIQTITVSTSSDDSETDSDESISTRLDDNGDLLTAINKNSSNIVVQSLESPTNKNSSNIVIQSLKSVRRTKSYYHMIVFSSRFKRISRYTYDVYFVTKEGITKEFYQCDSNNLHYITNIHSISMNININNCCWYKRDEKIKNDLPDTCINSQAFLRIPHPCDLKQCKCCCRKKYMSKYMGYKLDNTVIEQKQNRNYFQNRWHQRLLQNPVHKNKNTSIINEALFHTPKRKIDKKYIKKHCYLDTYLNLKVGETQKLDYYIDKKGLINTMVKTFDFHDKSFATNDCKKNTATQHSQYIEQDICCLDKYKKYILKLVKLGESNIAKCIINVAKCIIEISLNRCDNCENVEFQASTSAKRKAVKISLPKYPKHAINYTNKKVHLCNVTENKNSTQIGISGNTEKSNTNKIPIVNPKKNSLKLEQEKLCNTIVSSKNINTENSVDLDFEDLQLIIAPGGSVKIHTKTNPETISTENLKFLREIIRFTNNKIASQNLNLTETVKIRDLFNKTIAKTLQLLHNNKTIATVAKCSNTRETSVNSKKTSENEIRIKKFSSQPVTSFSKRLSFGPVLYVEKPKENIYQSFTNVNAQKRTQYLVSHEFITNAGTDLWTYVKKLVYQHHNHNTITIPRNIMIATHNEKENIKRKTVDKSTSPPPKQMRKAVTEKKVKDNDIVSVPSTSGILLRNALLSSSVQQNAESQPTDANVTTLPNNMTVIPIGQLPQDLVQNLYNQYAMLEPQRNNEQIQIPGLVNIAESASLHVLPAPAQMSSIPVVLPATNITTPIKTENVTEVDNDDDCILGV